MPTPLTFLKETKDELKRVVWPSQNEVVRLTVVVIFFSVLVSLFIGALDFIFTRGIQLIVK